MQDPAAITANVTKDSGTNRIPGDTEAAILIVVATIGMIGNFGIMMVILVMHNLRRASNAFIFHHSILDFFKAAYCLPFALSIMTNQPPVYCNILGGSYVVFVTTSAFNMLAMVMNEAYQLTDLTLGIKDSRNYCCVFFGIFTIWFASLIMNLGVAFIPGNPSFNVKVGHCVFQYGITRNYVLHVLWIFLVSMALGLTVMYLRKLYQDIRRSSYYRFSALIRATISIDPQVQTASQRRRSVIKEKHHINQVEKFTTKKLALLTSATGLYIFFWYPLFILTVVDPFFQVNATTYRILTMFAWIHPTTTPIIFILLMKTNCCCRTNDLELNLLENEGGSSTRTRSRSGSQSMDVRADRELPGPAPEQADGQICNNPSASGFNTDFFTKDSSSIEPDSDSPKIRKHPTLERTRYQKSWM